MSAPAPAPQVSEEVYSIPATYRKMENTHILFWLLKDIAWRTRALASELAHNLAIVFWITANSYWMTSEFFGFDTVHVTPSITGKHLALVPFLIGLGILLWYYLVTKPRENREAQTATL